MRHEDVAQHVSDYDVNNAYQYIINREETHVSWLQHAMLDLLAHHSSGPGPDRCWRRPAKGDAWKSLAGEDARANKQFVETWRPEGRDRDATPATRAC